MLFLSSQYAFTILFIPAVWRAPLIVRWKVATCPQLRWKGISGEESLFLLSLSLPLSLHLQTVVSLPLHTVMSVFLVPSYEHHLFVLTPSHSHVHLFFF